MIAQLDHNATTAPALQAVQAMLHTLQHAWANPSSTHGPGQEAKRVLVAARAQVAAFVGCMPSELVFGSGATEANHHAVLGALASRRAEGRTRWLLSAVEHPGLMALATRLEREGVAVQRLGVDRAGRLDLAQLRAALGPDVALVSLMGANNETGVLQPTAEAAALAQAAGAWLHVDATQLAGKAPLDFAASGWKLMTLSAHKLHGPKGCGALVVRRGLPLAPLIGGRQERQRRGGTENLPGIAGFGAACERAARTLEADVDRMARLRDRLERGLLQALPGVHVYGANAARLPNTSGLRFGDLPAEQVLNKLESEGVVASSGSACSAGGTEPSHVLLAMGETPLRAKAAVRFSLGRETSEAEIEHTLAAAARVLGPLLTSVPERTPA